MQMQARGEIANGRIYTCELPANAGINAWNETLSFSYDSEGTSKRRQKYLRQVF